MQDIAVEDFDVTGNGRRLRARWLRPSRANSDSVKDAPAIIFLHEGLGCIEMWGDFPARVCQALDWPVLIYDRYGYGGSEALDGPRELGFMEREAWAALPDVLAATKVQHPVLFGHSDGGTIALLYATRYPVRAVISEAAHIFQDALTRAGEPKARDLWARGVLPDFLRPFHGKKAESIFEGWIGYWSRDELRDWRMDNLLPKIAAPVLAIQGADDDYGTVAQLDDIAAGVGGPSRRLLIPNCGHIPHQQAEEIVIEASVSFLSTLEV